MGRGGDEIGRRGSSQLRDTSREDQVDSGYAPVNGLRMYYEVHGSDGAGRPLVLLHGGLLTIDLSFGDLLPGLAAGRRVIATELQGHGRTADIERDIDLGLLASDVAGLLDHLGVGQADVLGFSLGGGVALQLTLDHPDRVGRLIPASAGYASDGYHQEISDPAQHATSTRMPTAEDFRQMREAYERLAPDPGHFDEFAAKVSQAAGNLKGWTADELGSITAPTLLVFGDHDFIRLEHAVQMHGLIPGAQLAVLPGTTHMGVLRRTDLILPLVTGFLG
jgi:pimeloyl-ACP methyl ester carboxylesterase